MIQSHHNNVFLQLRCVIIIYKILFDYIFEEIECKTDVKSNIAIRIFRRIAFRVGNEDFHDVLTYIKNVNRNEASKRVSKGSQMFVDVRNVILKHNILKLIEAVDKENLFSKINQKRLIRFTLKRI